MMEIRVEIDPKNKTPLECINLLVNALENLVKNQDIDHYVLAMPSSEGIITDTFEAIHAGGSKDVKG
jgi:hypothetical protein